MTNFAKPGNPGAKFKNLYEKMIKTLTLPKAARDELGISDDAGVPLISQKGESQGDLADKNDKS